MVEVLALIAIVAVFVLIFRQPKGRCRQCRKKVDRDAKVCPYCGNDFGATES